MCITKGSQRKLFYAYIGTMMKTTMWPLMAIMMLLVGSAKIADAQTIDSNYVDGVVYVKVLDSSNVVLAPYNNNNVALNLILQQYAVDTMVQPFPGLNSQLDKTFRVHFSNHAQIDQLIIALQALPFVEYAEKEPIYRTESSPFTPDDIAAQQFYLDKIYARDAWGVSQGSPNIVVAIVDNGLLTTHQDLASVLWVNPTPNTGLLDRYPNDINGWDVADGDNNPNPPGGTTDADPFVHGTLCAGLAGAKSNNGVGIASIGFNIRIMAVKCTKNSAAGNTLTNAYDGVYYAIQAGADVISMSWGGSTGSFLTGESIINSGASAGIVMLAAAGNDNTNSMYYPAAYNNVIAVTSTDANDTKSSFSNYGTWVDIAAPGRGMYTTSAGSNTSYGTASGTSLATPLVAGLAALILSNEPSLSPAQVKARLLQTSDDINALNPNYSGQLGAGRINAARALGTTPTIINGVGDLAAIEVGLQIYPNPGNNNVFIELSNGADIIGITLHDATGKVVLTQNIVGFDSKLHVNMPATIPPGFYIWRIKTESGIVSRSWIKN